MRIVLRPLTVKSDGSRNYGGRIVLEEVLLRAGLRT